MPEHLASLFPRDPSHDSNITAPLNSSHLIFSNGSKTTKIYILAEGQDRNIG